MAFSQLLHLGYVGLQVRQLAFLRQLGQLQLSFRLLLRDDFLSILLLPKVFLPPLSKTLQIYRINVHTPAFSAAKNSMYLFVKIENLAVLNCTAFGDLDFILMSAFFAVNYVCNGTIHA